MTDTGMVAMVSCFGPKSGNDNFPDFTVMPSETILQLILNSDKFIKSYLFLILISPLPRLTGSNPMYWYTFLTSFKPGTVYRFQISSTDSAGNIVKPPIRTIITPRQNESIVDVIFKNFDVILRKNKKRKQKENIY